MLSLIGLGIWDENDISLRGVECCKRADKVYCELYTAAWGGDLEKLGKTIGKKIEPLERADVEERSHRLIEEARTKGIALLVPGDPLTATTHVHLIMECKERKIGFEIVHASSIYTAVAKTGLQLYKFGRTATVITPKKGYESSGFYDTIVENQKLGLHTLLLLDRDMGTGDAIRMLKEIEDKKGGKTLKHAIICSMLGSEHEIIVYSTIRKLSEVSFPSPAVVIIPGKLHFMEKEFLDTFR